VEAKMIEPAIYVSLSKIRPIGFEVVDCCLKLTGEIGT
jgi:hypothetical protein